jgi:hypothetical protein
MGFESPSLRHILLEIWKMPPELTPGILSGTHGSIKREIELNVTPGYAVTGMALSADCHHFFPDIW